MNETDAAGRASQRGPTPSAGGKAPRLELRGVTKRFGEVVALRSVDLALGAGAIHGVLGENGAGKSTLVNVVAGIVPPDSGVVAVDGVPLAPDPHASRGAGVGVVHQHFALIGPLTVAENLRLGVDARLTDVVTPAAMIAEARAIASEHGLDVGDPATRCDRLPVGVQARVEILRELRRRPRVLVLDEPTAVLTPPETAELFATLRGLRESGVLVILITHKLEEALAVCDAITILRQGAIVATVDARDASVLELARAMVGPQVATAALAAAAAGAPELAAAEDDTAADSSTSAPRRPEPAPAGAGVLLEVRDLATVDRRSAMALRGLGFEVRAGEILGVAGVDGNGQDELAAALYGLTDRAGTVRVRGTVVRGGNVSAAHAARLVLIPPDRRRDGLALGLSTWENGILSAPLLNRFRRAGMLDRARARAFASELARAYRIGRGDPDEPVAALSGGNQQRLVIGRVMALEPLVLIAANATRGLDIAATTHVHATLRRAALAGVAILLISTDLDELAALCERVLVLYRGRLLGPVGADERDRIGALMGGLAA